MQQQSKSKQGYIWKSIVLVYKKKSGGDFFEIAKE